MTTSQHWPQIRSLFHEALEQPAEARAAFVRDHAETPTVRRQVESLLATLESADGFLSTPAIMSGSVNATPRLVPPCRLGVFEIVGRLGVGGMGEVYSARDTRLDRAVAIKVLGRDLASHLLARERFEREARVISKLTHPHVCTLHDVGVAPVAGVETPYLVMELVDGETLATRLRRGALPVDQAVKAALEIADALAAAHGAGIVHRDLKPANIMLTRSGVKLLDFGLARLRPAAITGHPGGASGADPLTGHGTVVGTLPYMSPEHLRGEQVDARTDIFAFGAVLYEMLAGTRAFQAGSHAELIAAILEHDPPRVETRAPLTSPALSRIVATCLAKDPDERWPRARDLVRELTWVRDDAGRPRVVPLATVRATKRRWAGWAATFAIAGLAAAGGTTWRTSTPVAPAPVTFSIDPPKGTTFPRGTAELAVSPDGRRLAFVALSADGTRRIWVRRLDALDARLLDGTDDAHHPFWSPDGHLIGFFTHDALVKIRENGGAREVLSDVHLPRGGTWAPDGTILFASNGVLNRVDAAGGGAARPVTTLTEPGIERGHAWPAFLPDGRRFLYVLLGLDNAHAGVYQGTLDSMQTKRVLAATNFAVAGTHLFSLANRSLIVQVYDPDRGEALGEPVAMADRVGLDVRDSQAAVAVTNGTLAYRRVGDQSRLAWYDRRGRALGSFRESADYQHPWLSPDEKRVAVEKTDPATGRHTIWTLDVARDVTSRLVVDATGAHGPVWSPDGGRVVFASNRLGGVDVYSTRADGTGDHTLHLSSGGVFHIPTDWSLDGRLLLYVAERGSQRDLWVLPLAPPGPPRPFLATNADESQGRFSPDVKWMAYTSNESGVPEVYVRHYPGGEGAWRVSTNGGAQPQWRRDGKELFYLAADGNLMAADVKISGPTFETGTPKVLFDTGIQGLFVDRRNHYVVTADGQRVLVNLTPEDETLAPITVVLNWDARLAQ